MLSLPPSYKDLSECQVLQFIVQHLFLHLGFERLIMASFTWSSSIPLCSSSLEHTHSVSNEVRDVGCSN